MSKKLFIGSLSFQVSDEELADLFKQYGEVLSAKVITDRMSGRSRGFGFVEMSSDDGANQAIEALNGADIKGRPINVSIAREKTEGDRGGGFRNSGGGGGKSYKRDRNYDSY